MSVAFRLYNPRASVRLFRARCSKCGKLSPYRSSTKPGSQLRMHGQAECINWSAGKTNAQDKLPLVALCRACLGLKVTT